jgi:hypothetical protein
MKASTRVQRARDELAAAEAELEALVNGGSRPAESRQPPPPVDVKTNGGLTLRDRVRRAMAGGQRRSTSEVAGALGEPQDRVGDAMKRLEIGKELRRVSPGVYAATTKLRSVRAGDRH